MTKNIFIFVCVCIVFLISCDKKPSKPEKITDESTTVIETPHNNFDDFRAEVSDDITASAATGFLAYSSLPWKKGIIPVAFDFSISQKNRDQFWAACRVWSEVANVQCRPKQLFDRNYLQVTDKTPGGCWTDLGAGAKGGKRVFNFPLAWCWNQPALIHEVGHVLGFMHEHQRPDRDKYIEVHAENAGEFSFAYDKLTLGSMDNSGPYDFMSIMHYWNGSYSINGKPIMVPLQPYAAFAAIMGRSTTLTEGDKNLVRSVYGSR